MGGDENLEKSYGDQIIVRLTFLGNHSTGTGDPGMGYPKGYGAAISETLTWGGGSEVPLTEFFLTVYLWANCCKTTFHQINLVFF